MLKKDLIKETAKASGYSEKSVREIFDAAETVVLTAIAAGGSVMLLGLGKLVISKRGPKKARDMVTGDPVVVPPRKVAVLKPSEALNQAANRAE